MQDKDSVCISFPERKLKGVVQLPASKSITNRVLIIRSLCEGDFNIKNISKAEDSQTLEHILAHFKNGGEVFDVGHAGTTFRFLTAFLAIKDGVQTLTGSKRMLERPIGPLVEALRQIGAKIEYLGEEGYPPLRILSPQFNDNQRVVIPANISSQFLSALLLVGAYLPNGLVLVPKGQMVSSTYLSMTIALMRDFGAKIIKTQSTIQVKPGVYQPMDFEVESDWSAASYFFGFAVGVTEVDLLMPRLFKKSLQGDQAIVHLAEKFGIGARYETSGLRLYKTTSGEEDMLDIDFLEFPDLAQTIVVMAALSHKTGFFTGLETLKIKETNRIVALQQELKKVGLSFSVLPPKFSQISGKEVYTINGKLDLTTMPLFSTYEDHRMAMAFSMLATQGMVTIEKPRVVKKSFPDFWIVLKKIGVHFG